MNSSKQHWKANKTQQQKHLQNKEALKNIKKQFENNNKNIKTNITNLKKQAHRNNLTKKHTHIQNNFKNTINNTKAQ